MNGGGCGAMFACAERLLELLEQGRRAATEPPVVASRRG